MGRLGDYMLLREQLFRQQKIGKLILHTLEDAADNNKMIQMTETRLYVGLNDAETKKQKLETEQYLEQLKKICFTYHVPFSVGIEEGGYFHENGEYVEEKTLVLTLIDIDKDNIRKIAEELCSLFHQESVLITEDVVRGSYIK